ncbi:4-hydroxy-tetrahydrodipicolinate reductase [Candidatus Blochmannia ocreatus (nom. nud.)]|uniref:4-hydroxy-tetrahydrodipicolinate reductase n=1 Tax=Candidatus Blochmannia ocreatus (nom. nud.) TaxID=251538 RepID=A0ABY4SZD9_9ENTR|nr:4-hydroxy-tetrahydrodipicolinate reductase [Candidatus Blochmannia ocreatus]URJ25204.1 4-hydroxy-tetrahydrodipicolinate reductase [Candidatus Blochmannia ocreatus]
MISINNSSPLLRIAVTGITGRMGKKIIEYFLIKKNKQLSKKIILGAAIVRKNSSICGIDIGTFNKINEFGVKITDNLELIKDDFDTLIDFTAPDISIQYLNFCVKNNKSIVIGTTGFKQQHKNIIRNASKTIGVMYSANFSIGIALILKILHKITKIIGNNADISIIETHHNKKRDIPSGTAIMMQDLIRDTLQSIQTNKSINYNLKKRMYPSKQKNIIYDIPIHSIRIGNVVGEHTVLFNILGERLEITHKADDRAIFAYGALCAAIWLGCNKKGLFEIHDIL